MRVAVLKNLLSKIKLFYFVKLLSSLFTQLASLFLIYLLRPSEYGHLALIISVAQLMFIFTSGWSNGAIINLGSKSYAERGSYKDILYYRTIIVLVAFFIVSLLFFGLKTMISSFILEDENYWLVYILFLGYVLYDYASQILYPGNKDLIQSLSEMFATLFLLTLTFLFVRDISSFVYTYSAIYLIFAFFVILLFVKFFGKQSFNWNKDGFLLVLRYSCWQIMSVVGIYIINIGTNYVLVFANATAKDIGLYNFAFKLFSGFSPIFGLFGIIVPKWIYTIDKSELRKYLSRRIVYIVIFLAILYLIVAVCLKPFIVIIGKEAYLDSVFYFILLFPAFVLMSYSNLMNTIIVNSKHFKSAQIAIICQVICIILFSYPLVVWLGIKGAILATTVAYLVCVLYQSYLYNRKLLTNPVSDNNW